MTTTRQRSRIRTSAVIRDFGQWAVTAYGLECTEEYYPIEKARLGANDWETHVCEKRWVRAGDFVPALHYARVYHDQPLRVPRYGRT